MRVRRVVLALALALLAAASGCAIGEGDTAPTITQDAGSDARAICSVDADCPASSAPCLRASCNAGSCGVRSVATGTIVAKDIPADCHAIVCDGAGRAVRAIDVTSLPATGDPCVTGTCDETGATGTAFAAAGTMCTSPQGGSRCDGVGKCVECLVAADCPRTYSCNVLGHCEAPPCDDHVRDRHETDIDCGGDQCPPCRAGRTCKVDSDCASSVCDAIMHTCIALSCKDGTKDNNESDVDCGGACSACAVGKACAVNQDCASSACDAVSLTCAVDPCTDHRKETTETDVDCGGTVCPKCAVGLACRNFLDCASNVCDGQSHLCIPYVDPCTDGVRDSSETDVDCGGGQCPGCALGKACWLDFDCASQACDGIAAVCVADACADHRTDGVETDVDCGGSGACARCVLGRKCRASSDCAAGLMCAPGIPHVCL